MADKKIGRVYNSLIRNINNKINKQQACMKVATNNPDYIYMLGNKCIKPTPTRRSVKRRRGAKKYTTNVRRKNKNKNKSQKKNQRGGSTGMGGVTGIGTVLPLYNQGNISNAMLGLKSGLLEQPASQNVLPWEGHFPPNYFKL